LIGGGIDRRQHRRRRPRRGRQGPADALDETGDDIAFFVGHGFDLL
jgi:hypothetical protein